MSNSKALDLFISVFGIAISITLIASTSIGIQNHNECCDKLKDRKQEDIIAQDSRKNYLIIMLVVAILALLVDMYGVYSVFKK